MAYITQADLAAYVQADMLAQGVDDAGDGSDSDAVFAVVYNAVEKEIHGSLAGVYAVPFASPYPSFIVHAALVLAAYLLYARRGAAGENNPWREETRLIRERMQRLARREERLDISAPPDVSAGSIEVATPLTYDRQGRLGL